jgi:hypothetical protein
MIRQSQVIVGAKVQDSALRHRNFGLLRAQQSPLDFVQSFGTNIGQLLTGDLVQHRISHRVSCRLQVQSRSRC